MATIKISLSVNPSGDTSMAAEPVTGIAPSHWASYLVNGDASGIDESDQAKADKFAAFMGGPIVSCEDAGFCWTHDANRFGVGGSDCQEYTALVVAGDLPAVRIIGEFGSHGEPSTATLQVQDWFVPWADYRDADQAVLLAYVSVFYFGDF